jgi:hypothetical protein
MIRARYLGFVERVLSESYSPQGSVGRPHRSLLGMFKIELVKRVGGVESYRKLHRLLQTDDVLRGLCDIEKDETRALHVLLCLISMLITALLSIKNGFADKMRSPTFWSYITCSK